MRDRTDVQAIYEAQDDNVPGVIGRNGSNGLVLEGVGIVDHAYVIALLSFVVLLALDLGSLRPGRRKVQVRVS